jgi:hypothetical protein
VINLSRLFVLRLFKRRIPVSLNILTSDASPRLAPVEQRFAPLFCFALLTSACALASFAFACATPFAAFAVIAAAMLPLRSALLVVAGSWLVNQAIGFGMLHYPVDANTFGWGFAIGAAALAGTVMASLMLRALPRSGTPVALALALLGAYVGYEIVLFAVTPFLGGEGAFSAAIVARLGALSALWLVGLGAVAVVCRVALSARGQTASP